MNGLVLDKKRLRTMMAGVFTVFVTAVPFLLALYSADNDAVAIYGQTANNSAIYAYRRACPNDRASSQWHSCNWHRLAWAGHEPLAIKRPYHNFDDTHFDKAVILQRQAEVLR
jgi:hypothetical protein